MIADYCRGVADARAGRARRGSGFRKSYGQGYDDERARMRAERRLAQTAMEL